jgi:hypothetical protein
VKKLLLIIFIFVWLFVPKQIFATDPVPVNNKECPADGTVYPPNSDCYSPAKYFEIQEVNLSGNQVFTYPLSCITAPTVTYTETVTGQTPPSSRVVNVTTDISEAQLGFLGPDSATLATSNPDRLAQKYLFN